MTAPTVDSVEAATDILRKLTGNRWTWPPLRITEIYEAPSGGRQTLLLAKRPVIKVEAVADRHTGNPITAELSDGFRLRLTHQGCCSAWPEIYPAWWYLGPMYDRVPCPREIQVQYVAGSRPAGNLRRAILQLAGEMDAALDPNGQCRLPQRVTSVSRQGFSWTMIDPMDFLVQGRTGLYFVDLVIASVNAGGKVHARARVFSPEHPPPRRLSAVRVDPATLAD